MEHSERWYSPGRAVQPESTPPDRPGEQEQRVHLVGPLDAFSARSVEGLLEQLVAEHPALVVDLSQVDVLTSGGLAMLERCRARAARAGHRMSLRVRPGSIVQRVLEVAASPDLMLTSEGDPGQDGAPAVSGGA